MKYLFLFIIAIYSTFHTYSQTHNQQVEDIINEVDLNSLIYYLRNLSGEDPVVVNGTSTTITHRVSNWGNDLAAAYLKESLEGYGLTTTEQTYSSGGKNIYAIQEGAVYPDEYVMICAHYDSVDYVCADDNGSGTSAVLEAARIFSELEFEYSIIYALWDEEELGLIGSDYYATQASNNGQVIHAVINLDMIAWDGDGDMKVEIHSSNYADSAAFASYIVNVNNLYNLQLDTVVESSGTGASDHASFWYNDYSAVLLIEEYYGGDFNPFYHTPADEISILHMPYFHEMSKLALGVLAQKAVPIDTSGIDDEEQINGIRLQNYPNPSNSETSVSYTLENESFIKISLLDNLGKNIKILVEGVTKSGNYQHQLQTENLASGMYFLQLQSPRGVLTNKLLIK